jgi:hypothetical protein
MIKFKSLMSALILTTFLSTSNIFAMDEFGESERFLSTASNSSRDLNPSETIENGHLVYNILTTKEGYVEAKTRLCILRELLKTNPEMTINTRVPSPGLLWPLYQADKLFIEDRIVGRSNKEAIQNSITYLHGIALKAGWDKNMSISDLNWIGKVWVHLLSSAPESQTHALASEHKENTFRGPEGIAELMKYLEQQNIDQDFQEYPDSNYSNNWMKSHGFIMPLISPTGVFPLSAMRESWSFFRQDGSQVATYLDFLAVPTDALVDFDYAKGYPPCDAWNHDATHVGKFRFTFEDHALASAKQMATMLQNLENARLDISEINKFDIAFFHVFHESQVALSLDYILYRINTKKDWTSETINSEIIPIPNSFHSVEQYQSYVDATELLGIHLEGEDLIEKYRSYLKILLEGLDLLEKFVHTISEDSCALAPLAS